MMDMMTILLAVIVAIAALVSNLFTRKWKNFSKRFGHVRRSAYLCTRFWKGTPSGG